MKNILISIFLLLCISVKSQQTPYMTGALINACSGSCQEGDNEILFFNSGGYNISTSTTNFFIKYNTFSPATTIYTSTFTTNPTYINTLNTTAGCGTLFIDALTVSSIPTNSSFMIVRYTICYPYNLSSFCLSGPVYVFFTNDVTWNQPGNFANTGSSGVFRYFRVDFTGIGGSIIDYNYQPNLLSLHADGDAVTFPIVGGAADSYFNNGCNPDVIVLPIELISFDVVKNVKYNTLKWTTASETNNDYFTVERSKNAILFNEVCKIKGAGSSDIVMNYTIDDNNPYDGITYYRLKQTDYNGIEKYFNIISINNDYIINKPVYYDLIGRIVDDPKPDNMYIKNTNGKIEKIVIKK